MSNCNPTYRPPPLKKITKSYKENTLNLERLNIYMYIYIKAIIQLEKYTYKLKIENISFCLGINLMHALISLLQIWIDSFIRCIWILPWYLYLVR